MARYFFGRLGQALIVLLAAYIVTFILLYIVPLDTVDLIWDVQRQSAAADEEREKLRQYLGLNQPIGVQFFTRLIGVLHGDFGVSVLSGRSVLQSITDALQPTLILSGGALILALLLALVIAVAAVTTRARWLSSLLRSIPAAAVSVPTFLVGLVLLQVFSYQLHWFPSLGHGTLATLVLPTVSLALPISGPIAQLLIANLDTEMSKAYIATAYAKGMTRRLVIIREALKNACLPALTMAGLTFGYLLAGSIIIETVFSRPGIGRLAELAVRTQDILLVQGIVLFAATVFVAVNLMVDLVYWKLDPRLRRESKEIREQFAHPILEDGLPVTSEKRAA